MGTHLTGDIVGRLRRRELSRDELAPALRHISECASCEALASEELSADVARMRDVLAEEAGEPPRHLEEAELFGWVDGSLDPAARDEVRLHLDECKLCRDDVADLERLRMRDDAPASRAWTWFAAAAAAAALILMYFAGPDTAPRAVPDAPPAVATVTSQPAPAPEPPANREWNELVSRTLASGRLPFPDDLVSLRGESETLRGETEAAPGRLEPSGVYIDATTPEMSWPRTAGAAYVVTILRGDEPVARSGTLREPRWTPPRPLERGATYAWQVEVVRDGTTELLPPPTAPPAMFRIVSAEHHRDIESALEGNAGDHLLLAALYARAGLEEDARRHLDELAGSTDPRIQRLRSR